MGRTDTKAPTKAPRTRHAARSNSPSNPSHRASKTQLLVPVVVARQQEGHSVERPGAKPWVDGRSCAFCCAPLSPDAG